MIDANAINSRQQSAALNQIEAWRASGAVQHLMSDAANREARAGGDARREAKAGRQLIGISHHDAAEQPLWNAFEKALFPKGARTSSQQNDVEIVFQAHAWGYVLVTNDGNSRRQPGGILGAAAALSDLGVKVMRPEEFVELTRVRIAKRDERVRQNCAVTGTPLPDWLGQD
ncbi:MAG: hypothetical protein IT353_14065 [Gemmatimonadaceae bacterium]|nr:hypothetical protein [Gemmatimonadaceae bacterium]